MDPTLEKEDKGEFTSRLISLLASNRASAFLFMIFMFSPNKLTSSA
jgi:hypothetical protein